jgi:hypothetical protein
MADYIVDTELHNTKYDLTGSGDTILVTSSGSLLYPGSRDIISDANSQTITIDGLAYGIDPVALEASSTIVNVNGTVQGTAYGVVVQAPNLVTTTHNAITVGSQGTIEGTDYGVLFSEPVAAGVYGAETFNTLTNHGTIQATGQTVGQAGTAAISASGDGGDLFSNTGLISGTFGIQFLSNSNTETIDNSGTIEGSAAISSTIGASGDLSFGISIVNAGSGLITNAVSTSAVIYLNDGAGTTSTIDNQGTISGPGFVIQSASDALGIANSGTIHGGLDTAVSGTSVDNSGLWQTSAGPYGLIVSGGSSELTNEGKIAGSVDFSGSSNLITNSGEIGGNVTLGASSTLKNHNQIYGDVTLGASDTMINTGTVHGGVTLGASDTINDSRGEIANGITAASNDTFIYKGNFGNEEISGFVASGASHDTIDFGTSDFANFTLLQKHMVQVGTDVVIRLDTTDAITLGNTSLANLVAPDFKFV